MSAPAASLSIRTPNRLRARRRLSERVAFTVIALMCGAVIAPILLLFGYLIANGAKRLNWSFLNEFPNALDLSGGVFPALVGTILLMIATVLIALPLGIVSAIYLVEYATRGSRLVGIVRQAIINLAGVPSIVHGLFGLGFFVFFVGGTIDRVLGVDRPIWGKPCLLWGACTLAVVVLPVIITATEEALLAVPQAFRDGSTALGSSKWNTIRRVVLPAALPGILTGAILSLGRAAGETAPVMITCAASFMPGLAIGLNEQQMLLPYHLYFAVTQVPNAPLDVKAGIALVLIGLVSMISLVGIVIRTKVRRARKW